MNVAAAIRAHQGQRHVLMGPFVYRLRRVCSADLLEVGHAELVGDGAAAEALAIVQQELLDARTADPAQRAAARAHNEGIEQRDRQRLLEEQLSTPEGRADWLARMDAYVVAAVTGAGRLRVESDEVVRLLPTDARVADYTDAIDDFRFVGRVEDEGEAACSVTRLEPLQRQRLGLAAMAVAEVVLELVPFRAGSGTAADAPPGG